MSPPRSPRPNELCVMRRNCAKVKTWPSGRLWERTHMRAIADWWAGLWGRRTILAEPGFDPTVDPIPIGMGNSGGNLPWLKIILGLVLVGVFATSVPSILHFGSKPNQPAGAAASTKAAGATNTATATATASPTARWTA